MSKDTKTRYINGWYITQMKQVLKFIFRACFIDCTIKPGNDPVFICQLANHVDRDLVRDFTERFINVNHVTIHFTYVIEPPRKGEFN